MKKPMMVAVALLIAAIACAQLSIDGTWKIDCASLFFLKQTTAYEIKDGRYTCSTCVPSVDVKADGTDQQVTGSKYRDAVAVTVVDDHTVRVTSKKDGKV